MERWNLGQHVLQQTTLTQASTTETENSSERDEVILSALPATERRKLELAIRKLHHNWSSSQSCACANVAMKRCQGECAGCRQITPLQGLRRGQTLENRKPWRVVGCDMAEWNHPVSETRKVHLWICADQGAKFTVGLVWAEGQQAGNIDGSRVLELLQERWTSVLGRTHTLRTDPEGAWRNREVHDRPNDMQIALDLHSREASLRATVTENTIGIVKDTMTRIAL